MVWRSSDNDGVKGGKFLPTVIAVVLLNQNIFISQFSKDGSWVTRTGLNLLVLVLGIGGCWCWRFNPSGLAAAKENDYCNKGKDAFRALAFNPL